MIFRRIFAILLLFGLLNGSSFAEDTPQDLFFKLYFTMTAADHSEKKEDYATALQQYEEVNKGLADIKKRFPDWEPSIINFRTKYVKDKIASLQDKIESTSTTPPPSGPPPSVIPPTPPAPGVPPASSPSLSAPISQAPAPVQIPDALANVSNSDEIITLRKKISDLESELFTTKKQLSDAQREIATLNARLATAEQELDDARKANIEDRVAAILNENKTLKDKLNEAQEKIKSMQGNADTTALAQLKDQLTAVQEKLTQLSEDNQKYQASNGDLKQKLELAQQKLAASDLQANGSQNSDSIHRENDVLRDIVSRQLLEQARRDSARKLAMDEIDSLKIKSATLQKQIEILSSPLVSISPDLLKMLNLPATPNLSAKLDEPTSSDSPANKPSSDLTSVPTAPPANPAINPQTNTPANVSSPSPSPSTAPGTTLNTPSQPAPGVPQTPKEPDQAPATSSPDTATPSNQENVTQAKIPDDMREIASQAGDLFKKGPSDPHAYDQAAALYDKMIQKYPDSLYAWSNLGVVRFEQQRFPEAEKALLQAIKINPKDAFAHSVLGIVFYQLGRFDEAIEQLTNATAIDPKDARSQNYLGIACSQKGWQEAAEKALHKAIDIDPNYADAHFNLAVIYATQKPPMKELAKKHYQRALDLGTPKDAQLEKLLE